jgi:hypothetical protein
LTTIRNPKLTVLQALGIIQPKFRHVGISLPLEALPEVESFREHLHPSGAIDPQLVEWVKVTLTPVRFLSGLSQGKSTSLYPSSQTSWTDPNRSLPTVVLESWLAMEPWPEKGCSSNWVSLVFVSEHHVHQDSSWRWRIDSTVWTDAIPVVSSTHNTGSHTISKMNLAPRRSVLHAQSLTWLYLNWAALSEPVLIAPYPRFFPSRLPKRIGF